MPSQHMTSIMERPLVLHFAFWLCSLVFLSDNSNGQIQPSTMTLHSSGSNVCTYKYQVGSTDNYGRVTYTTRYRCCDGWRKHNAFSVQCMVRAKCSGDQFACDNGRCVHKSYICNGNDNCGDGSDERMCGDCPSGYFRCSKDDMCLPRRLYCDQIPDCGGSRSEMPEDEMNCGTIVQLTAPTNTSRFGHVYSGVVSVWHNSGWGSLCDDYMDINDAQVLCRQLGFKNVTRFFTSAKLGQMSLSYPVWLRGLNCDGKPLPQFHLIGKRREEAVIP
ncbi:scavenger receptor cysteine-rich type 1 protein M130-like [Lingula anatina]|uniref:Scavenger receptor cysteine-rich type 1 protein M130-like n=1 Tax=Lingula anatina TaxID=7574 RepID=A0A1S3H9Q2_LINAN|nr:scavenger receptor cysteine-rich type 1 protein M130-like [Lingula anatina]|eukprot:XP_013382738.1 scavenger receptor cysteine-rich type 1 protein M130-like [Lingula anatina]